MVKRFITEHYSKFFRRYLNHGFELSSKSKYMCAVRPMIFQGMFENLLELEEGKITVVQQTNSREIILVLDGIVYQTRAELTPDLHEDVDTVNELFTTYHNEHVKVHGENDEFN